MPRFLCRRQPALSQPAAARWLLAGLLCTLLSGCASLIIDPLLAPFERSLEEQSNLDLLHDGTPSLLLMIDGMLANDPDNRKLLISGTKAYASYAVLLAQYRKTDQAKVYAERGKELAFKLLATIPALTDFSALPADQLNARLGKVEKDQVAPLFWGGYGWAIWAQQQAGSPEALAALTKIEPIMNRMTELAPAFNHGSAHIFLGALHGAKPPMFGGKPKVSLAHFEEALLLGQRKFLAAQVAMAETYARQVFDRELFKSLLEEVLAAPIDAEPRLQASNSLAKKKAEQLLERIDEFF